MLDYILQCLVVDGVQVGDDSFQPLDIFLLVHGAQQTLLWKVLLHHLLADYVMLQVEEERLECPGQDHGIVHRLYIVVLSFASLQPTSKGLLSIQLNTFYEYLTYMLDDFTNFQLGG